MAEFLFRQNCEYSLSVEAETKEEALKIAMGTPLEKWDTAWSLVEEDDDPGE